MKTEKLFKTALTEPQAANSSLNHLECEAGMTVLRSYPRRIVLELTNKCNFQCVMCGREAADFHVSDLPFHTVKACGPIFRHAEEVTLFGWGEGTLHPRFRDILGFLDAFPLLRKYFVTNGSTIPRIMDAVFDFHVDLIAVSIDGATPERNDAIRRGGDLKREMDSLRRLVGEKLRRGLPYPYINFVFTAMASNIHELPMMVELAREIGLPEVKAVYLTVFDEKLAHESLIDRQELVKKHFNEAMRLAEKHNINLKLPDIQGGCEAGAMPHKPCAFPWRDMFIGSDGFLRPCQSSAKKLLNISRYGSFEEIWNSKPMQEMRDSVNDERRMPVACRHCFHSSCANWNQRHSFLRYGLEFSPAWEDNDAAFVTKSAVETPDASVGGKIQ